MFIQILSKPIVNLLNSINIVIFFAYAQAGIFTIPYDAVYDEPLPVDGHGMLAMEDVTSDRIVTLNRQKSSHNQQRAPLPEDPVLFTIDEVDDSITELPIPNGYASHTDSHFNGSIFLRYKKTIGYNLVDMNMRSPLSQFTRILT